MPDLPDPSDGLDVGHSGPPAAAKPARPGRPTPEAAPEAGVSPAALRQRRFRARQAALKAGEGGSPKAAAPKPPKPRRRRTTSPLPPDPASVDRPATLRAAYTAAQELVEVLRDLSEDDLAFARSLLSQFYAREGLSDRQWHWVNRLAAKARGEPSNVVIVMGPARHRGIVAEVAARLDALAEDPCARREFIRSTRAEHEDRLVALRLSRHHARREARALIAAAETYGDPSPHDDGGRAA